MGNQLKKNVIVRCFFFTFFILMLLFPGHTLHGASSGLLLWFNTLLPVLLPFMILSGLIIRLNIVSAITSIIYPVLKLIFPISKEGSYPVFIGFLSGLPVGAKLSADLVARKKISKKEGSYIASLCNNASPTFLLNYVAVSSLLDASLGVPLCIIIYLSAIIASYIYAKFSRKSSFVLHKTKLLHTYEKTEDADKKTAPASVLSMVDQSIIESFEIVTKIGGYIILFSVLSEYLALLKLPTLAASVGSGFLEITTGIHNISLLEIPFNLKFTLIAGITAFGGLSGFAQTQSVLTPAGLPLRPYILTKLIQGIIAGVLSTIYLFLINIL